MAKIGILKSQDLFRCPLCLNLLNDPVTLPCGRSFCKVCIYGFWDQEDVKGVYSCPQCRDTFTPRPVLRRNNVLNKKVKELKETEPQAASPAHCYTGPVYVECDLCTRRKYKAVNSCLVCLASYCEDRLKPHYHLLAFKKNKLVEACVELQEKTCSQHDKLIKICSCTDHNFICCLCKMYEYKCYDTDTNGERPEKQNELKEEQIKFQQRIQEKQRGWLRQIADMISSFPSLCVSPGCEDSPSFTVNQHLSFDGVRKSLSDLKKRVEEICEEEFNKIRSQVAAFQILSSQLKNRQEFLQYFCYLTLDPTTAHHQLILSEKNRVVTRSETHQQYSDQPERFNYWPQVLCKEIVCGRCYWEVEWSGAVSISVAYKEIIRKGMGHECLLGYISQSWTLLCSSSSVCFWHNKIKTDVQGPVSSRIGVYVDHSAGTLSFYSICDTMRLLHTVQTTFTQPLYAGFCIAKNSAVRLCDTNVL